MMRSLYSGVAGLRTHQTKMDVVGNNIANVNTYAYKSQRATFRDMYYQTIRSSSTGVNATQLGYGAQVGSIDVLHTQAGYAPTDRPMDVYIDGEGFITVSDPNGGEMFTRIGALSFMPDGNTGTFNLVDMNGNPVMGLSGTANRRFGHLAADGSFVAGNANAKPGDADYSKDDVWMMNPAAVNLDKNHANYGTITGALAPVTIANFKDFNNVSIGANGVITGIDKEGKVHQLGLIPVAKISNPEGLTMQGSSYYKAINNTGEIEYDVAGSNGVGGLIPGALEMSNVDLAKEFTDMITTQRGYQANSRIISVVDEMLQELVNLKR